MPAIALYAVVVEAAPTQTRGDPGSAARAGPGSRRHAAPRATPVVHSTTAFPKLARTPNPNKTKGCHGGSGSSSYWASFVAVSAFVPPVTKVINSTSSEDTTKFKATQAEETMEKEGTIKVEVEAEGIMSMSIIMVVVVVVEWEWRRV